MIGPESLQFEIGSGDWVKEVRSFTDQFDPEFWDKFSLCSEDEIEACERQLDRKFPDDFREFLLRMGTGQYSIGGYIFPPKEIAQTCIGPFWVLRDTSNWDVEEEEQRRIYVSRGAYNPRPDLFTDEAMTFDGVNLFDLQTIGSNGEFCDHLLHLGASPRPFGYCLLDISLQKLDNRLPSFTDSLKHLLTRDWESAMGLEEKEEYGLDLSQIDFTNIRYADTGELYRVKIQENPLFDPEDPSDTVNPFEKNRFGENRKRFSLEDENEQTE